MELRVNQSVSAAFMLLNVCLYGLYCHNGLLKKWGNVYKASLLFNSKLSARLTGCS